MKVRISSGAIRFERLSSTYLQLQQQHAGNAERGGDPILFAIDKRADQIRGKPRHLGGDASQLGSGQFMPVGQHQEPAHNRKTQRHWQQLAS